MSLAPAEISFVEIPRPGQGHTIAEEAALLLLQGIRGILVPSPEQIEKAVASELDTNPSLAAVNEEGTVVGTGGIQLYEIDDVIKGGIVNMVVTPSERGRGIGTAIMSKLETAAARAGAQEVFGQQHPGSLGFYERRGCEPAMRPFVRG
ncbi:MAG TPA: GNAT family N-acetyltransferase, partial [Verrucomicrobiae bacterium]|nr:GNAT family N-acetyltransferase [Verrucomicrobiae bacterium]